MEPTTQIPCTVIIPFNYTNLIIPLATIVAAIIGGWWVYTINRANSIRSAKYDFLSSVLECFEGIYPSKVGSNSEVFSLLRTKYPKLNSSVHKLRFYIDGSDLISYDQAWGEYEKWYANTNEQSMTVHAFYGKGDSPYTKLCHHIESLLIYAKI